MTSPGRELGPDERDLFEDILSAISLHTTGRGNRDELSPEQQDVLASILATISGGAFSSEAFDQALMKIVGVIAMHLTGMTPDELQSFVDEEISKHHPPDTLH
ncbi:MAG: hypothetical protein AAFY29_22820 [Pseudomonadota bacterium]